MCAPDRDAHLAHGNGFRPGDVVGHFELIREVGRGGFGVVFEARDRERDRRVALKMIRPGARLEPARESLLREIEAGRLRHPNIVEVLEAGSCDRGPYIAFEYLCGETLEARLKRGPLCMKQVIGIAAAVARALAYAHAQGVLHRDLKPGNVFLPSTTEAKVIDFGLARIANTAGPPASGTSGYMSPEQRRGDPEDARTDLFALGLLAHEMATGKPLLRRDRPRRSGAPSPSAPGSRIPPALGRLVAELVEDDPARRPGSADEVLGRLLTIGRRLAETRRWRWHFPEVRDGARSHLLATCCR